MFYPTKPELTPPLLNWPLPFTGNLPVVLNPFNVTELEDNPSNAYKKTRVQSNVTIVDAPDIMLQGNDDFMQVEKLVKEPSKKHKEQQPTRRTTDNTKTSKQSATFIPRLNNHTAYNTSSTKNTNMITNTNLNNNSADQKNDNTSKGTEIARETNVNNNDTVNRTIQNTTTHESTSSSPMNTNVEKTTAKIADDAESMEDEKQVQGQVLADWIGEKIIENEIKKHKMIQENSAKRAKMPKLNDPLKSDDIGSSIKYSSPGDTVKTGEDTNHANTTMTYGNNITQSSITNLFKQDVNQNTHDTNLQTQSQQYMNKSTKKRKHRKRKHRHRAHVSRDRRSSDDDDEYSFLKNIFNNDLSIYMVSNGVETREQFETMFRKCNASKVIELKENKMATVSLTLFNKQFKPFDRVRVEEVKVYLHGATTNTGFLEVNIESESILQDKYMNKKFTFYSGKWRRVFQYKIPKKSSNHWGAYEIKADIHNNISPLTFVPTPFTTWMISVSKEQNPGLNLSGLTSIEILLTGSFVSNSQTNLEKDIPDFFESIKKEKQIYTNEQIQKLKLKEKEKKLQNKKENRMTKGTITFNWDDNIKD